MFIYELSDGCWKIIMMGKYIKVVNQKYEVYSIAIYGNGLEACQQVLLAPNSDRNIPLAHHTLIFKCYGYITFQ